MRCQSVSDFECNWQKCKCSSLVGQSCRETNLLHNAKKKRGRGGIVVERGGCVVTAHMRQWESSVISARSYLAASSTPRRTEPASLYTILAGPRGRPRVVWGLTSSAGFQTTIQSLCRHHVWCMWNIQGDHSACAKPPVDFKTHVPLAWPDQAKAELLFWSQREVLHKVNGHPVCIQLFKFYTEILLRYQRKIAYSNNTISRKHHVCSLGIFILKPNND